MSEVRLSKLEKTYPPSGKTPAFPAVKGIDLIVREREFMVLVGPSGCGKSTTLRMIAGLEEITSGEISIGDRVVNTVEPKDRDIAMVFQNYALYPHMSVFDNMGFALKLRRLPRAEIKSRVLSAAKILGIESMLERKPLALSGGQRQRVALGRAIVRDPQVFLFDEPLSNLDAKMRVSMRTEINQLHARLGATMIYVTHDQVEAMTMGDRICVMNEGRIMQLDTPIELYNHPQNMFVAGFIGSPPMNFLPGRIVQSGSALRFVEGDGAQGLAVELDDRLAAIALPYLDRPVVFGIRPEAVVVLENGESCQNGYSSSHPVFVELIEPHGAETLLYLKTTHSSLIARKSGTCPRPSGETARIAFDLSRVKLFDAKTEAVLASTAENTPHLSAT